MRRAAWAFLLLAFVTLAGHTPAQVKSPSIQSSHKDLKAEFRTSDRCVACHNGLKTKSGEDISIGLQWQASVMANSSRDPYWQGSARRESIDHPEAKADIENECSVCHMPITHVVAKSQGQKAEIFSHLPLNSAHEKHGAAADGVSCAVCHQIEKTGLGTTDSFNGNFVIEGPSDKDKRPEYGPFVIDQGHQRVMQSSTGGFIPQNSDHIRDSALCGSCHTLYTKALGPGGKQIGTLPEQMPYLEWLHSDYPKKNTCQSCHMPEVREAVAVTAIYGQPREGMHRHEFIGGNFLLQRILNEHRDDLAVDALPEELTTAADRTEDFLKSQSAHVEIQNLRDTGRGLSFNILVQNLTGHKFPTAYPSRRAWLHVIVQDRNGRKVFESGALNPDGSIVGNDNDADAHRFEPHYREITNAQQVEIFEPILGDAQGNVTTGLLSAIGYLKDNRILPTGFDKRTAGRDIAVVGDALDDPNFTDRGSSTRYSVNTVNAAGPFHVDAELWYQPIGYRWAHNLEPYHAMEPQRFVGYYESEARRSAVMLTKAEANPEANR
jgi:hypothetical protein